MYNNNDSNNNNNDDSNNNNNNNNINRRATVELILLKKEPCTDGSCEKMTEWHPVMNWQATASDCSIYINVKANMRLIAGIVLNPTHRIE